MVKELRKNGDIFYLCEACKLAYLEKELAERCQRWCEQYQSCNLEIVRYAVPISGEFSNSDF